MPRPRRSPELQAVKDAQVMPAGWYLYRVYGWLPDDAPIRFHLVELLLGRLLWLLYIGITGRDDDTRWGEHYQGSLRYNTPPSRWASRAVRWERSPRRYDTEVQARAAEKAAIIAENPFENTEHAPRGGDKRPRRRIRYRPTRVKLALAKAGTLLAVWAALTWLPWRIVTTQWPQPGTHTYLSMGVAAGAMLVIRLAVGRSPDA